MILSATIVLALSAADTARRASAKAAETRHATALLQGLLASVPAKPGVVAGQGMGFGWRVETRLSSGAVKLPGVGLCERFADAKAWSSGKRYALWTSSLCAAEGAAS